MSDYPRKKVAIIQSNYIPWKGYFDIIHDVDLFIFHDDIQYTKNDWRNRNKVKTEHGTKWLTIPVGTNTDRLINEVQIKDHSWQKNHWRALRQSYAKTRFFKEYEEFLERVYVSTIWDNLSDLNQFLIKEISRRFLGIQTEFLDSTSLHAEGAKLDKVLNLLEKVNAGVYVSGPAAKSYIDETQLVDRGIELIYKDYTHYPTYQQLHGSFEHEVTILDLLFHTGPEAPYYIWGWRNKKRENAN